MPNHPDPFANTDERFFPPEVAGPNDDLFSVPDETGGTLKQFLRDTKKQLPPPAPQPKGRRILPYIRGY